MRSLFNMEYFTYIRDPSWCSSTASDFKRVGCGFENHSGNELISFPHSDDRSKSSVEFHHLILLRLNTLNMRSTRCMRETSRYKKFLFFFKFLVTRIHLD